MSKEFTTAEHQIISEIHGKLCDQGTGEPTGLNQFFDELLLATIPDVTHCRDCEHFRLIHMEENGVSNETWICKSTLGPEFVRQDGSGYCHSAKRKETP